MSFKDFPAGLEYRSVAFVLPLLEVFTGVSLIRFQRNDLGVFLGYFSNFRVTENRFYGIVVDYDFRSTVAVEISSIRDAKMGYRRTGADKRSGQLAVKRGGRLSSCDFWYETEAGFALVGMSDFGGADTACAGPPV